MKQLYKIRHTRTLNQSVCQILKTNNVTFFYFMFYVLYLTILNFVIVSKMTKVFFPTLPCKQSMLERTSMEKLKFNHLHGMNVLILKMVV